MDLRGPGALECPLPGVETQLCTRHCGAVAHRHEQKGQAARVSLRDPGIGEEVVELERHMLQAPVGDVACVRKDGELIGSEGRVRKDVGGVIAVSGHALKMGTFVSWRHWPPLRTRANIRDLSFPLTCDVS